MVPATRACVCGLLCVVKRLLHGTPIQQYPDLRCCFLREHRVLKEAPHQREVR